MASNFANALYILNLFKNVICLSENKRAEAIGKQRKSGRFDEHIFKKEY